MKSVAYMLAMATLVHTGDAAANIADYRQMPCEDGFPCDPCGNLQKKQCQADAQCDYYDKVDKSFIPERMHYRPGSGCRSRPARERLTLTDSDPARSKVDTMVASMDCGEFYSKHDCRGARKTKTAAGAGECYWNACDASYGFCQNTKPTNDCQVDVMAFANGARVTSQTNPYNEDSCYSEDPDHVELYNVDLDCVEDVQCLEATSQNVLCEELGDTLDYDYNDDGDGGNHDTLNTWHRSDKYQSYNSGLIFTSDQGAGEILMSGFEEELPTEKGWQYITVDLGRTRTFNTFYLHLACMSSDDYNNADLQAYIEEFDGSNSCSSDGAMSYFRASIAEQGSSNPYQLDRWTSIVEPMFVPALKVAVRATTSLGDATSEVTGRYLKLGFMNAAYYSAHEGLMDYSNDLTREHYGGYSYIEAHQIKLFHETHVPDDYYGPPDQAEYPLLNSECPVTAYGFEIC